jgi:hypothetical protein
MQYLYNNLVASHSSYLEVSKERFLLGGNEVES